MDINVQENSIIRVYSSDQAVAERLRWIKDSFGEETYLSVLGNIVLTKKILKAGDAYKKEFDALPGVGVENWLLQHRGNMVEAFRSFWDAAHDGEGNQQSLNVFKERYHIFDPATNLFRSTHDDFVSFLAEDGYKAMLAVIGDYLHLEESQK